MTFKTDMRALFQNMTAINSRILNALLTSIGGSRIYTINEAGFRSIFQTNYYSKFYLGVLFPSNTRIEDTYDARI